MYILSHEHTNNRFMRFLISMFLWKKIGETHGLRFQISLSDSLQDFTLVADPLGKSLISSCGFECFSVNTIILQVESATGVRA